MRQWQAQVAARRCSIFWGEGGDVAGSDHPKKYIDTGTEIGVKKSGNHNQTSQFHEVLGYCIYCEEMIHRLHA